MTEPGTLAAPTLAPSTATIPPPPPTGGTPASAPELPGLSAPQAPPIGVPMLPDSVSVAPAAASVIDAETPPTSPAVASPSIAQVAAPSLPTITPPSLPTVAPPSLQAVAPSQNATPTTTISPSLPSIAETQAPARDTSSGPPRPSGQMNAPSEIPEWKRRQNSKVRKMLRRFFALAVLGGIGAAGYFAYLGFNEQNATAETDAANGDPTVFDETRDLVDGINDNQVEADLLAELGLDASGGAASANVESFTHTYRFGPANVVTTSVDASTGNSIRQSTNGEIRSIDSRSYERIAGAWTDAADQTVIGNTDLLRPGAIVPDAMIPFIVASQQVDATTVAYEVDEFEFSSTTLDGWRAWNTRWTDAAVRTPVAGDRVSITITLNSEGLVSAAAVILPNGDSTNYTLDEWSGEPLLVELS